MTIDERFERLEHFTAGWADQFRQEQAETRQLWRKTDEQINALSEQFARFQREAAERSREIDERFRQTDAHIQTVVSAIGASNRAADERIQSLVSVIGQFIRKD